MEEIIYFACSVAVAVLAVWSAFVAYRAMQKGLTYSSMAAVVWVMVVLAIGRIWHSTYEILGLRHSAGDMPELVEYAMYILAYAPFIWLSTRVRKIEGMPKQGV